MVGNNAELSKTTTSVRQRCGLATEGLCTGHTKTDTLCLVNIDMYADAGHQVN